MVPARLFKPAAAIVAALAILALAGATAACGGDDDDAPTGSSDQLPGPTVIRPTPVGEPRSVRLGLSALPVEQTTTSYINAFATAAQYADLVLVQRAPPWQEFMPGGSVSEDTQELTTLERKLLDEYDALGLFFAIDPTDGVVERSRIANLPPSVDPSVGFNDLNLREAFVGYATYVAANYKPDYLALGVEINMLYARDRAQFDAFVSLYREAYAAVKEQSSKTKVFPTFQLEDLEGSYGTIHPPQWEVIDSFEGAMDALAISTYPYLGGVRSAADIRQDYYSQLRQRFKGEILLSEVGYASAPVEGKVNVGTEQDQQAFVERVLNDAERNDFSAVVWLAARDPVFVAQGAASVFRDIGLRKSDGGNKLAWNTWEEWALRPLQ